MDRNRKIYEHARRYLLSFEQISNEMLDAQLNEWRTQTECLNDLSKVFHVMINAFTSPQGKGNYIGDTDKLRPFLFDFDHGEVLAEYNSWEELFDAIITSDYTPPGRMDKNNPRNTWVQFCKCILSIAKFLSIYKDVGEFNQFVQGFYLNEYSRVALPLLLEKEIFGYGFAVSCDFLKDAGYPEFIKPDTHVNDIAKNLGITHSTDNYQIFKDLIVYCRSINKLPFEVDKLFWLVGSGRFYLYDVRINTSKWDFINSFQRIGG